MILELLLLKRTVNLWHWLEKSVVQLAEDHKYNTAFPYSVRLLLRVLEVLHFVWFIMRSSESSSLKFLTE